MTDSNAIETQNLTKEYDGFKAVDSVDLKIKKGQVFGLLGPNGAGKTTLISMLITMRKPSKGKAKVNGFDIEKNPDAVRKSIGIVFQDPSLDEELTARENLDLHASMYSVPKGKRKDRINMLMDLVGLKERVDDVVKTFSGGMKRRLEIARGLLHKPKVLFLDEPTIGLDPQTRKSIWSYIKKLSNSENITIILTTHYMDEADKVCDETSIIDNGKIVVSDSPKNLKNELGGDVISVRSSDFKNCIEKLKKKNWIEDTVKHDGKLDITVERGEEKIPKILSFLEKEGVKIDSVNLRKPSLDDVFLHFTGKTIREKEATAKDRMRTRRKAWGKGR